MGNTLLGPSSWGPQFVESGLALLHYGVCNQLWLGNDAFVERMQTKSRIRGDALTVPQIQRSAAGANSYRLLCGVLQAPTWRIVWRLMQRC